MGRLFNMDNKFFTFMGKVADLIILNLICVLCCLPIVTIGPSLTALHYVTMKMVRNEESYIVKNFFKSFKENFKQATIINLIMLVVGIMLFLDINIVKRMSGKLYSGLFVVFIAFLLLYMLVFLYIYPVLAKFYNTIKHTFINAFLMSIRHLPYTFVMLVITLLPIGIFFIPSLQLQSTCLMLLLIMGPAVIAYLNGHFLVRIFDNYIPKEEDAQEETLSDEALPENTFTENPLAKNTTAEDSKTGNDPV
ncbi:MAG: YesL family protein [Blautia sp.]|nr:YesL family protein [Eubacteriales bacterium]MED9967095.1 YesL family protein [Blautia sp.]